MSASGAVRPVLLGYQALRLDSSEESAENGCRVLRTFSEREGFAMGMVFTDFVYGRMAAFNALLEVLSTGAYAAVGVPTLDDLSSMPRLREAMRLRMEQAGGVRLLVAQPELVGMRRGQPLHGEWS